ncbi:helix-turn-helix domain-containing protein [Novosphingobium sp.]|uniref:AraC family transcriptional regulator n=1 Tax=Novosphingobium sp. TaxID=1874826 RepID=UPI0026000EB7|nr:helix-turn-helix domain-containing protein [Novosphingobium sp.]
MIPHSVGDRVAVRFFMPSPALTPYISTYYLTEVSVPEGEVIDDYLHPEWGNIRLARNDSWQAAIGSDPLRSLPHLVATGPSSYSSRFITGTARIWGIGILPLGWTRFFDVPASDYADRFCDALIDPVFSAFTPLLGSVFGDEDDAAAEAMRIDAHLLSVLDSRAAVADANRVRAAHAALVDPATASVTELAARIAMSPRSLERLSLRTFGFPPKLLLRRQRFLRSLAQFMLDPSLKWIATLDWQYVDQAHFVRDFKRFMGMSPSAYAALDHPVLRAAAQARRAAAGEAVQALHRPA